MVDAMVGSGENGGMGKIQKQICMGNPVSSYPTAQTQAACRASPRLIAILRGVVVLLILSTPIPALAQTVYQPPGLVREIIKVPIQFDREQVALSMMILRPQGPGPFPLASISHGTIEGTKAYLRKGQRASGLA